MVQPSEQPQKREAPKQQDKVHPIEAYLKDQGIAYERIPHETSTSLIDAAVKADIPVDAVVRTVLLKEQKQCIMALLPASYLLDFEALCKQLNKELEPAGSEDLKNCFHDCDAGSYPPLPEHYKLKAIVDDSLKNRTCVYLEPGTHDALFKVSQEDFQKINENSWYGHFAEPLSALGERKGQNDRAMIKSAMNRFVPNRIKDRLEETFELPAMPPIADKILKFRVDPTANGQALARLVEMDPSLAAQIVSWARSPYYGYPGKIDSVEDAIVRVLGFDLVMNLALGLAVGKTMRMSVDGPLGLKAYWTTALYTATLAERLAKFMPESKRPSLGLVYLSGLLHNFGHLILGQVFPPQFYLLNRFVAVNTDVCITQVEGYVLGVGHEQIGAWLMKGWHLPEEVISTARHHHDPAYMSDDAIFVHLILIATRLLKRYGIGDAFNRDIPQGSFDLLGLNETQATSAAEAVFAEREELDTFLKLLTES